MINAFQLVRFIANSAFVCLAIVLNFQFFIHRKKVYPNTLEVVIQQTGCLEKCKHVNDNQN